VTPTYGTKPFFHSCSRRTHARTASASIIPSPSLATVPYQHPATLPASQPTDTDPLYPVPLKNFRISKEPEAQGTQRRQHHTSAASSSSSTSTTTRHQGQTPRVRFPQPTPSFGPPLIPPHPPEELKNTLRAPALLPVPSHKTKSTPNPKSHHITSLTHLFPSVLQSVITFSRHP